MNFLNIPKIWGNYALCCICSRSEIDCNQLFHNYKHPNYVLPYQHSTHLFCCGNRFRRLHHLQKKLTSQRFFNWNQQLPCHTQKSQKYLIFLLLSLYVIMLSLWWLCMIVSSSFFCVENFVGFSLMTFVLFFFIFFCLFCLKQTQRTKEFNLTLVKVKIYVYYDSSLDFSFCDFYTFIMLCYVFDSIHLFPFI